MDLNSINGLLLKKMIIAGANELNDNKQLVDSLNVFPVPDGDTGTNMSLTALAAAKECEKINSLSISEVSKAAANGSLRGARGNSGVILSQLFRGFSKGLEGLEEAGVMELSSALKKGVATAYKAVMKPKEGTILTVARALSDSGEKNAVETDDIEMFIENIIKETLKNDGAVGTTPVKDTLYYSDKDGKLLSIPKREYLYLGQNPECFLFSPYYKIHLGKTPEELKNYSGAVQIAIENNMKIGLAVGKDKNFKITTDEDINIFKYHLNKTVYSGREHSKKEQL